MAVFRQAFCRMKKFFLAGKCVNSLHSMATWLTMDTALTKIYPRPMVKKIGRQWPKFLVNKEHIVMRGLRSKTRGDEIKTGIQIEKPKPFNNIDPCVCLRDILATWINELMEAGIPEPEESASLIVAHVCGKKMIHEVDLDVLVEVEVLDKINNLCKQRLHRVPVQYIIGEWDFHDMTLKLEPGVLIPRPETEELGGHIVKDVSSRGKHQCLKVLDIGCGNGALCLYILKSLGNTHCVAVDKSKKACNLTRINAEEHCLQDRLDIIEGDFFTECCIRELLNKGPYDVVVSNPPYIPAKDMDALEPEVSRYEDHEALYGGTDGLDVVMQILKLSKDLLQPETGLLWLEVDLSHPDKVEKMVQTCPKLCLKYLETIEDFTKRGRFCKLQAIPTAS